MKNFCLDSDLSNFFFELIRFVLFRTLVLLPFRLCLDHSLKELSQKLSLYHSAPFPLFCECKGTTFSFLSNTFLNFFLFFLNYFYFGWLPTYYIMKNIRTSVISLRFFAFFRLFCSVLEPIWMKKYHKIQKSGEKQSGFSTVFSRQQDNKSTRQSLAETRRTQRMLVLWRHINPHPQLSTLNL